ncbi:winged helix-turn-helix transcriptional regulator [Leifsonia sp. ZF2019]|nr:winged helix-turn-helix transcriptional regulator [Leifsonia sp. ZF2019]
MDAGARQARRPAGGWRRACGCTRVSAPTLVPVFAALGDDTRWSILSALAEGEASASALDAVLPVSRQAIAKHLAVLQEVGLVEPVRVGREVRFRVLGSELSATARRLDEIGAAWDRRLAEIKRIAEGL